MGAPASGHAMRLFSASLGLHPGSHHHPGPQPGILVTQRAGHHYREADLHGGAVAILTLSPQRQSEVTVTEGPHPGHTVLSKPMFSPCNHLVQGRN